MGRLQGRVLRRRSRTGIRGRYGTVIRPVASTVAVRFCPLSPVTIMVPCGLAVPNCVKIGLVPPFVTVTLAGDLNLPVESVPGPVHAVPAQLPFKNRYPPETVWKQMFCLVVTASILERPSALCISAAAEVRVAPRRELSTKGKAEATMTAKTAKATSSSESE